MTDQRTPTRTPTSYDPFADITSQGWRVQLARLNNATERYDTVSHIVYVDPDALAEDQPHALAHVAAHLHYDLDQLGRRMTAEQEACANSVAYLRLDREWAGFQ